MKYSYSKFLKKVILFLTLVNFLVACQQNLESVGSKEVIVFDNVNLNFDMEYKTDLSPDKDSILHLDAGRVLLKKVNLPVYAIQPDVRLSMTLTSNGDPWDKSGSVFVIPKSTDISTLDFEKGHFSLKSLNEKYPAVQAFQTDSSNYLPNLELLRFMTPFGVGHFSENERALKRKPVYIPHWEKQVNWEQDVSQLLSNLEGEVYIGVFIDTWTKEGYQLSLSLHFEESEIPQHQKKVTHVIPMVNTIKYAGDQRNYDRFSKTPLRVEFELPEKAKQATLYYTTTGHGGHATGDEFVKKENIISLNDSVVKRFIPWRDDCASFRRFNPTSGVWSVKVDSTENSRRENLASSDLSRSNWCPGSKVEPELIELGNLSKGKHLLEIDIPEAQERKEGEENYWMVSAYIVFE